MAIRSGMTNLIARVKSFCNGDTTLTDDDYQQLLDDHAIVVDSLLTPRVPFYVEHVSPFENLEEGSACKIYYGYNTLLVENTDYTADYQRGIFTTPAANYRGLRVLGKAYDINAAAADGWEHIAQRYSTEFDFGTLGWKYERSQQIDMCLKMAARYRKKAWAISHTVERGDTPPLDGRDWREDVRRREKAGYTQG